MAIQCVVRLVEETHLPLRGLDVLALSAMLFDLMVVFIARFGVWQWVTV